MEGSLPVNLDLVDSYPRSFWRGYNGAMMIEYELPHALTAPRLFTLRSGPLRDAAFGRLLRMKGRVTKGGAALKAPRRQIMLRRTSATG